MRKALTVACFLLFLAATLPVQAQLRQDAHAKRAPVKLFDQGGASFLLNQLFSPEHFRMQHSYEMSIGSFGGRGSSLGMYTNTMLFQFNEKLAARVDVSFAHSPFGNSLGFESGFDGQGGRLFLRNAEIAYRPSEKVNLHFSVHQSPFGYHMGPYGYYNPYYGGLGSRAFYGGFENDLFW